MSAAETKRMIVLASGNGSNFQAIINARDHGELRGEISALVCDNTDAFALERAAKHQIESQCIVFKAFENKNQYHQELLRFCQQLAPDLVVLAGYMRILKVEFVQAFRNRILNIHPSLLPRFPGLDTYKRVLLAGDKEHGTTVHIVTEELDAGPMIAQAKLLIQQGDTEDRLRQRVQNMEHRLYPKVIRWFAEQRIEVKKNTAYLDGRVLPTVIDESALL